jgi:hypothetical protein
VYVNPTQAWPRVLQAVLPARAELLMLKRFAKDAAV